MSRRRAGEPLLLTTVHYRIRNLEALRQALAAAPDVEDEEEGWVRFEDPYRNSVEGPGVPYVRTRTPKRLPRSRVVTSRYCVCLQIRNRILVASLTSA